VLNAAYNDAQGVTAAFNRNLLRVLDRELGADFDPDAVPAPCLLRSGDRTGGDAL
jgi:L-histidine N-alpha-methyltransferase